MDSSGLYEALPLGSWWASLRFAASVCVCGAHLSLGVDVGALLFVPRSAGVCGFLTSNVMGLILFKLNPMSFSSKDLKCENEPDLFMWVLVITLHNHLHLFANRVDLITCCLDDLVSIFLLQIIAIGEVTWNRN